MGYNLAVFFYGCGFNCLFCQNYSHKRLDLARVLTEEKMVAAALQPEVRCVCFFGGSPEPQLPFAIRVSEKILERSGGKKRICWEWNGSGNSFLVRKAAELSARSGGTVKFDLKASHPCLSLALCGIENGRVLENFSLLWRSFPADGLLTATTLLVSSYIDEKEVGEIARFIAGNDPTIPYSLLLFHPDYLLTDLPPTPRRQVEECYAAARRYLSRVNVGNMHLL
ncbi:MAG: radical SAM protein [Acidobacteriota bacterium]